MCIAETKYDLNDDAYSRSAILIRIGVKTFQSSSDETRVSTTENSLVPHALEMK